MPKNRPLHWSRAPGIDDDGKAGTVRSGLRARRVWNWVRRPGPRRPFPRRRRQIPRAASESHAPERGRCRFLHRRRRGNPHADTARFSAASLQLRSESRSPTRAATASGWCFFPPAPADRVGVRARRRSPSSSMKAARYSAGATFRSTTTCSPPPPGAAGPTMRQIFVARMGVERDVDTELCVRGHAVRHQAENREPR